MLFDVFPRNLALDVLTKVSRTNLSSFRVCPSNTCFAPGRNRTLLILSVHTLKCRNPPPQKKKLICAIFNLSTFRCVRSVLLWTLRQQRHTTDIMGKCHRHWIAKQRLSVASPCLPRGVRSSFLVRCLLRHSCSYSFSYYVSHVGSDLRKYKGTCNALPNLVMTIFWLSACLLRQRRFIRFLLEF